MQERSGELDTGRAIFVNGTVTVPRDAPPSHVHEYISRCLAERSAEVRQEYARRFPEPRQPRAPRRPKAAPARHPKTHPKSDVKRPCAGCGSEERMLGKRSDALTCSSRCRQRASRRRRATLAKGREASHAA